MGHSETMVTISFMQQFYAEVIYQICVDYSIFTMNKRGCVLNMPLMPLMLHNSILKNQSVSLCPSTCLNVPRYRGTVRRGGVLGKIGYSSLSIKLT